MPSVLARLAGPLLALSLLGAAPARALTYGQPDCADNATSTGCRHPNVVALQSVLVEDLGNGVTAYSLAGARCSGSLLQKTRSRVLFLTAAHCAQAWMRAFAFGAANQVAVSFEGTVPELTQPQGYGVFYYGLGGQPLMNRLYGPGTRAFNIYHDYAVVEFPAVDGRLGTAIAQIDLSGIEPVRLPPLDFARGLLDPANPPLVKNVGYGIDEYLNAPGSGGNAGGAGITRGWGERWVSESSAVLNTAMRDQSMLVGSQNPARGYSGICNGDSGGPNFVRDATGADVQIGVSSSADQICRGMVIFSRLDIPQAQQFLQCTMQAASSDAFAACGCTVLDPRTGTCPTR